MQTLSAVEIGSHIAAFAGMFLVLRLQLLGVLLAGTFVHQLVCAIAPVIEKTMTSAHARWVLVVVTAAVIVGGLTGLTAAIIDHGQGDVPSLQKLLDQLMMLTSHARLHGSRHRFTVPRWPWPEGSTR